MFNMIQADIQRIIRGRYVYMVLAGLLGLIAMHLFGFANVSQTIGSTNSGATMPFYVMGLADNFSLAITFPVSFVIIEDFKAGTVKNVLSSGFSRAGYFLTKLVLIYFFVTVLYVLQIVIGTIGATILFGFDASFDLAFVLSVLAPAASQLIIYLALATFGAMIALVIRNENALFFIYYIVLLGPPFVLHWFNMMYGYDAIHAFSWLSHLDSIGNLRALVNIAQMSWNDLFRILGSCLAAIALCAFLGMTWLKKAEIK